MKLLRIILRQYNQNIKLKAKRNQKTEVAPVVVMIPLLINIVPNSQLIPPTIRIFPIKSTVTIIGDYASLLQMQYNINYMRDMRRDLTMHCLHFPLHLT